MVSATSLPWTRQRRRRRCRTGRRFGASAAMPPGATLAAQDRPRHGGPLPPRAAAPTTAASTATITRPPDRHVCRSAICDPSGARLAAAVSPSKRRAQNEAHDITALLVTPRKRGTRATAKPLGPWILLLQERRIV